MARQPQRGLGRREQVLRGSPRPVPSCRPVIAVPFETAPPTAMVATGWGCIVLGGLFAAVTGPLGLVEGSWLAAYLVLVGGVAQVAMGSAQRVHPVGAPSHAALSGTGSFVQLLAWNVGNVAVVGGTLIGETLLVGLGSLLLIVALVLALLAARSPVVDGGADAISCDGVGRRMPEVVLCAYRGLLLVLVVSIPIGIVMSYARND